MLPKLKITYARKRKGGTKPFSERAQIALISAVEISEFGRSEIVKRTETTQSEQARSRMVQVSQSIIMLRRVNLTTDN